MSVSINGNGSITGLSVGGLPDGSVDADSIAAGAVTNAKIGTGIDAAKLADGTVTSTELQYINSLSSNAQTQISGVGGKVLQMVYTTATFGSTTASASDNTYVDSSVTITLTPTTTASKFIVYYGIGAAIEAEPYDGGYTYRVKKVQSSTTSYPALLTDYGSGNHHGRRYFYDDALTNINSWHAYDTYTGVDADSHTTASLDYTVQFAGFNVGAALSAGNVYSARSQMIVWEVAN
jgi:hypothetical protein